jgi:hypothetical protein
MNPNASCTNDAKQKDGNATIINNPHGCKKVG